MTDRGNRDVSDNDPNGGGRWWQPRRRGRGRGRDQQQQGGRGRDQQQGTGQQPQDPWADRDQQNTGQQDQQDQQQDTGWPGPRRGRDRWPTRDDIGIRTPTSTPSTPSTPSAPATSSAPAGTTTTAARGRTLNYNEGNPGSCVFYALDQFHRVTGVYPYAVGDALRLADGAAAAGWSVGTTARPDSLAVFQPGQNGASQGTGHAAWVEQVTTDGRIYIGEMHAPTLGVISHRWLVPDPGVRFIYT